MEVDNEMNHLKKHFLECINLINSSKIKTTDVLNKLKVVCFERFLAH